MSGWNFADIFEAVAAERGDAPALINGDRMISYGEFDRRSDALAQAFLDAGMGHQAKVAAFLYNCPEYNETYFAAYKAGMVPLNTSYRYEAEELFYLFDNADAEAVVFHAGFAGKLDGIRARLPHVKAWVCVPEPDIDCPGWAINHDEVVAGTPASRPVRGPWGRSGDDLMLLYTGGTTGMPKGVMWRQDDLIRATGLGGYATELIEPLENLSAVPQWLNSFAPPVTLVACPLMHGTGGFSATVALQQGGTVVTLPSRSFDPQEVWSEVERNAATRLIIVGQAFGAPLLAALDAEPGRWKIDTIRTILSSGTMWNLENKRGLLRHMPGAMLVDGFSSSEALGMGASISTAAGEFDTAKFAIGPECAVFGEDEQPVEPGSGVRGLVAVGGFLPVGYYKDQAKTDATFKTIGGKRWSVPGDWAEVHADGTLTLLGRGSQCINTGGEKVFPEEVEEALKRHPAIRDAAVVGLPDERFGERICAVVEVHDGAEKPELAELSDHVKGQLAGYKAPRALFIVNSIGRAPTGKMDYKGVKAMATALAGAG